MTSTESAMTVTQKMATITRLEHGKHQENSGMCVMEAVSYVAGEPWSDHPQCVSPVIAQFCRSWNDALPTDEDRTRLLAPLIAEMIGTRTTDDDDVTRSWMVLDWLVRVYTPAWLRAAGLTQEVQALESCARIVDATTADTAQPAIVAALDAAGAAARAAAWNAAWGAVSAAAWNAAWDAAQDAAQDTAQDAARAALAPTVATLQASAVELVRAMCAVGREGGR
jgi:hypothetical protein